MKRPKWDHLRFLFLIALMGASIFCIIGISRLAERSTKTNEIVERHIESMRSSGIYGQLSESAQVDLHDLSAEAHFASIVSAEMKYYSIAVYILWILFSLFEIAKVILKTLRTT